MIVTTCVAGCLRAFAFWVPWMVTRIVREDLTGGADLFVLVFLAPESHSGYVAWRYMGITDEHAGGGDIRNLGVCQPIGRYLSLALQGDAEGRP